MFSPDMYDAEIAMPNFKLYRVDRVTGKGSKAAVHVYMCMIPSDLTLYKLMSLTVYVSC